MCFISVIWSSVLSSVSGASLILGSFLPLFFPSIWGSSSRISYHGLLGITFFWKCESYGVVIEFDFNVHFCVLGTSLCTQWLWYSCGVIRLHDVVLLGFVLGLLRGLGGSALGVTPGDHKGICGVVPGEQFRFSSEPEISTRGFPTNRRNFGVSG